MENDQVAGHGQPQFRIPAEVYLREVDGEMVLLDLSREEYFGLNETGTNFVKKLIEMSPDEALSMLASEYEETSADVLGRDMDALVASLLEAALLERTETA